MRQQKKSGTRKERLTEKRQARRSAKIVIGGCSKCGTKRVGVVRVRGGQVCVRKCLGTAISRLGKTTILPADQAIKAD